ncbi:MAG: hypothetical protein ACOC93_02270 [Planctomycetota bacterium]
MPCLIIVLALIAPRLVMFFIWLLTNWFDAAFETDIIPFLGFLFLPYTTLAYMGAMLNAGGITIGWLVVIIIAVIVDLGHYGGSRYARRKG